MRLLRLTASTTRRLSPMVRVMGFSHQMSLPARAASTAMMPCQWGGVAMCTMSTLGSAIRSR